MPPASKWSSFTVPKADAGNRAGWVAPGFKASGHVMQAGPSMATSSPDLRVGAEAVYPRSARRRARVVIRGAVQGVGFRPFVFRLALELGLTGWVANSNQGVIAEVEGSPAGVDEFILRLERDRPPHSYIQGLEASQLDPLGYTEFEIRFSSGTGELTALVLPASILATFMLLVMVV